MTTTIEDDGLRALALLEAEDARNDKIHDLLETIREQIRVEIAPEHRPDGLMTNIQNAVYAMRGRTRLANDAAITSPLRSFPAVDGAGEPVAWICDGCGRVFKDPAGDLHALRVSGALSCCPERKPIPLYTRSALSPTSDRASAVEAVGWQPIETADRSLTARMEFPGIPPASYSHPIWCRFERGAPFEASWVKTEDGKEYWWAWDLEDVVDPDEWMPHPLALPAAPAHREAGE